MTVSLIPGPPATSAAPWNPYFESNNPRAVVAIDGNRYLPEAYEITYNAHGATDEASITLPISGNPDFSVEFYRPPGSPNVPAYVQIWAGFPASPVPLSLDTSNLASRFYGIVDLYNPVFHDDKVTFKCRSFAAPLVDNKLTSAPVTMNSQQFAQVCANYVGLTLDYQLNAGATPITLQEALGQEFIGGASFNTATYNKKYWDMLIQLAQFDDADVWVDQTTLHYVAPGLIKRAVIPLAWGKNIHAIDATHSIQFSKNIQVEVRTYQKRTRQSTTVRVTTDDSGGVTVTNSSKSVSTSPVFGTPDLVSTITTPTGTSTTSSVTSGGSYSSGFTQPGSESGKERYIFYIPNITPARANQLAQAKWRQISMHEYSINLELPVTQVTLPNMAVTALLKITGLPYQFTNDQYWPRRITETMDVQGGWRWQIDAVNHTLPMGAV